MSATYNPVGLRMQGRRANSTNSFEITQFPLTTNNAAAIAHGDPVALVGGSVTVVAANPAAGTLSANTPIGVAVGFEYQDPNRGFVCSDYLASGAVSSLLYTGIQVLVCDDERARFTISANGSVAATAVGLNVDMGGFGAANAQFKTSRVYAVAADVAATATLPLRILGFDKVINNAAGDAFTVLLVSWNQGTHAYQLPTGH